MAKDTKKTASAQEDAKNSSSAIGNVLSRGITQEMQESYLDYAMSVIVARALPDVRDGLKPVHRRILYAMNQLGLNSRAKFRKSATVVGEVLGKFHPHGDVAVYDAMVRLAQDFSMRYPMVQGQGNFGSLDGDSAAAMRYTEAKMARISDEMLNDIDRDTVNFAPNYDGTQREPTVLPSAIPQLLLNGSTGIAVGMATSIPPHNLGELIDGLVHLVDKPESTVDDLLRFVKGPDFPTGGIAYGQKDLTQAYATGKGGVVTRAKTEIVEEKEGHFKILITEVPFQINKATLIEHIADLVRDKKIEGIRDVRDESDKAGVRVVIELKKDSYPKKVLNQLFSQTTLQTNFNYNMLALVDGLQPRVLTLKNIFEEFLKFRLEVVVRRTKFDLQKAKDRAHILEGLKKALDHIDAVIKTIKASKSREDAHVQLMKIFRLSDKQSTAILEMRLQTLSGLERKKIEDELTEKRKLIAELEALLKSRAKQNELIKQELVAVRERYADERRTKIVKTGIGEFEESDLIPDEDAIISMTRSGYIKRLKPEVYRAQRRGGVGIKGAELKEEDIVKQFFKTTTLAKLLFFTSSGRVFQIQAYEIPETSRVAKGQNIANFLQLAPSETVSAVIDLNNVDATDYLTMITRKGIVKKTNLEDFANVRRSGLIAIKLRPGDELGWVGHTTGKDQILVTTRQGQAVRFDEKDARPMGRTASGVRSIKLKGEDQVVGADSISPEAAKDAKTSVLVIMSNGYGKRTLLEEYKVQGRGGSGILTAKVTQKTGPVVAMRLLTPELLTHDYVIISSKGIVIRTALASVSELGRSTQGVRVMSLRSGDSVASIAIV
ncbi:MAG: DNA gyrase subunit A [bacterium]|nr:DNA gyrase subunit A [bacterium]